MSSRALWTARMRFRGLNGLAQERALRLPSSFSSRVRKRVSTFRNSVSADCAERHKHAHTAPDAP